MSKPNELELSVADRLKQSLADLFENDNEAEPSQEEFNEILRRCFEVFANAVNEEVSELRAENKALKAQAFHLNDRLAKIEAHINPAQAKAAEQLASLTTLQAAILQMYLRDRSGVDIDSRLGCSKGSSRQLKRRISSKLGASDVTSLKLIAQSLTSTVTDEQYLDATGIPKKWYEDYAHLSLDDDPYSPKYS